MTAAPLSALRGRDVSGEPAAVRYDVRDPRCAACARGACVAPSCAACGAHLVLAGETVRHRYGQCPRCGAWRAWELAYAPALPEAES